MALTKASLEGDDPEVGQPTSAESQPTFNTNADHPDEVVQPVREVPSRLVAEAKLRHELADSDTATPQERKQAAVEQAHALSTRPDGSYAQLHETASPSVAVADDQVVSELRDATDEAREALAGSEPADSAAGVRREEESARARTAAGSGAKPDEPQPAPSPGPGQGTGSASGSGSESSSGAGSGSGSKGSGSK